MFPLSSSKRRRRILFKMCFFFYVFSINTDIKNFFICMNSSSTAPACILVLLPQQIITETK